ncbi:hypothetical protein OXX79_004064 [Metschnikowia pulcherrima]
MYNPYQQGSFQNQGYSQYGQGYPAQPQATGYYQQQAPSGQYGQPQQPGLFQGQQTGFQQSLPPQQTGFQPQQMGNQPQQSAPQNSGYQQPQQTGYGFQGISQLTSQATGYAPSLQAQKTGFSAALSSVKQNQELHIPSMRLSFITVKDQTKFENLFRTAVAQGENAVSGDAARDILLRSGLSPVTLAEVWALADTNKSGSLLFPEFALALHLCNMALKGEPLPGVLPEKWNNEVQSFVDAISFSIPEDPNKILANTPFSSYAQGQQQSNDWLSQATTQVAAPQTSFTSQPTGGFQGVDTLTAQRTGGGTLIPLQPQQTSSFIPASKPLQSQQTGSLTAQLTGFQQPQLTAQRTGTIPSTSFQAQPTGGFQPQTSFQAQPTGGFQPLTSFQNQPTGGFQPQQTGGIQQQIPSLQSQQTGGLQPQLTGFQPQQTGIQAQATGMLQAQPTGKPGEWGFVHTPTGGLPGLNAMQQHFLPSAQLSSNNLQDVMGGTLKSNVTWAITKQEKQIYDGVFAAWDKSRKGYIDGDVAISIFNKSGLGRPDLESIWNLCDSNNRGKLNKDEFAVAMHLVYRRLNGLEIPLRLPPELIPPSAKLLQDSMDSLKTSLRGGSAKKATASKAASSATRFKNNDDNIAYTSSSRHRSRNPSDATNSSVKSSSSKDLTIEDLKKLIREKKILLEAADSEDQHNLVSARRMEENNAREIESTKAKIREIQSQLNALTVSGSNAEKAELFKKLNHLTKDSVPRLMSKISQVNTEIFKAKSELAKANLKKQYPNWNPESSDGAIEATGPNGEITESDRRKFKSKQLLRSRMAALTGKPYSEGGNSDVDLLWKQMSETANKEREAQLAIIKDIDASIKDLEEGASTHLEVSTKSELGSNKWEMGEGVSATLRSFIDELKAFDKSQPKSHVAPSASHQPTLSTSSPTPNAPASVKPVYNTPEERAAYIKSQAEKRMNERLAKLGISRNRNNSGGSLNSTVQAVQTPKLAEKVNEQSKSQSPPKPQEIERKNAPEHLEGQAKPQETQESIMEQGESSADESDEEYAALLRQKKEMEQRKKERDLKRKQEKEARLAKLKKEMALMERQDDDWSDDEVKNKPNVPSYNPSNISLDKAEVTEATPKVHAQAKVEIPVAEQAKPDITSHVEINNGTKQPHESNPFSRFGTSTGSSAAAVPSSNTNPFFKAQSTDQTVDQKKLEAQRASQRGLDNDDWSDDEQKSSDDEEPSRAGAAKLASLLFGGMPQPVSRNPTGNFTAQQSPAPPQPASQEAVSTQAAAPETSESDSDDEFATPPPGSSSVRSLQEPMTTQASEIGPSIPAEAPPVPTTPAPFAAPPIPSEAPPLPTEVPPVPDEAPPSLSFAPLDSVAANDVHPSSVNMPPPPPPPGPPPPPMLSSSNGGISAPMAGGPSDIGALLGQIQGGKSLKKVSDDEKHIADAAVVGRVL